MNHKFLLVFFLVLFPLVVIVAPPARAGTTINVNTQLDVRANDGKCSLREAVIAANTDTASGAAANECPAGSGADTINIPSGTYTLTIGGKQEDNALTGDLDIKQGVTINGAGTACANPSNPNCSIINANSIDRVFDITATVPVSLSNMEIVSGNDDGWCGGGIRNYGNLSLDHVLIIANYSSACGGGLYNLNGATARLNSVSFANNQAGNGAAINNMGILTLTQVSFAFDQASGYGGGLSNSGNALLSDVTIAYETAGLHGGGIYNGAWLTITQTTLNNNQATSGNGGGIYSQYMMWITNTTVSANTANSGNGGGIYFLSYYGSSLWNATLNQNSANSGGNLYRDTTGGKNGAVALKNTIIANSPSGGNCAGGISSLGYNLDSANTCALSATADLTNTNPLLGPLANNGGRTQTHALLVGSPAINSGSNVGCPAIDQRGFPRLGICDRGAFEYSFLLFMPLILK
jgi:CSLREA domain-containing protein